VRAGGDLVVRERRQFVVAWWAAHQELKDDAARKVWQRV